ncbi:MAG: YceI family protein [Bacteroidia bacterium]|nr:YceI family protein [Bacteroidia bacterium]
MKRIKKFQELGIIVLILLLNTYNLFGQEPSEVRKLAVESNHSSLLFSVPISNGITRITGKFNDYSITMMYDENDLSTTTIEAVIQVASIDTGIADRDQHLLSVDFFDATTYPTITFRSKTITPNEKGFVATGDFTMRGITKELAIPFVTTGKDGKNTFGFTARLTLNRMDHGVGSGFKHDSMENFLGEEIGVEIDFWTKKWKPRKLKE